MSGSVLPVDAIISTEYASEQSFKYLILHVNHKAI